MTVEMISVGIGVEATDLEDNVYTKIQTIYPNWRPDPNNLEVLITEQFCQELSELLFLAEDVPPQIFRYFGKLVGIYPREEQFAFVPVRFHLNDTEGHRIPAGTNILFRATTEEDVTFEVPFDVDVPAGDSSVDIVMYATEAGTLSNSLDTQPSLVDILDYVGSVEALASTRGGADAESDEDFQNRLRRRLTLLADRPILPSDFENYVVELVPGVARALCLDGYNPDDGTFDNERTVCIIAVDENGDDVSSTVKADIIDALEGARETNFAVKTASPAYVTLTVVANVTALPGWDLANVKANAEASLGEYINRKFWGLPDESSLASWVNRTKVRFYELIQVVNSADGVDYVNTLTLNGGTADVTMAGVAPLPKSDSTVTVTAVAA